MKPSQLAGYGARPLAVMAGLIVCAVLARLPFLSNAGVDEAFYLVVGRQWLEGELPYAGAFDVKPPLLFALMAAAEAVFGPSLLAAKALAMAAVSVSACGLSLFGRRFLGGLAGLAAALFYIAASLTLGGTFSPAELMMAPFCIFGMLLGFGAARAKGPRLGRMLAAGVLLGAGACVKQTALFEAVALAAFLVLGRPLRQSLAMGAAFCAGVCLIPAGFAVLFALEGHFGALYADVVLAAAGRAGAEYVPWSEAFLRLLIELALVLPLAVLALAGWARRGAFQGEAHSTLHFLAAWAAATLAGVLAARAMCDFYMLTALPPLCLLSGAFVECGVKGWGRPRLSRAVIAVSTVLFFAASVSSTDLVRGDSEEAALQAAAAMRSAGLRSEDRILAADRGLAVYLAAGANPPASIFHPIQLLCDFAVPGAAMALAKSLESRPAFIITAEPPVRLGCERAERRALLTGAIAKDYSPIGRFGAILVQGHPATLALYRRKEPTGRTALR